MYITETTDNVRRVFSKMEKFDDSGRLKFVIYVFDRLNNGHINSKNEANPDLIEDDEMIIFSLDTIGVSNNFTEIYLEYLTMVFNNVATKLSKSYQENGNVMGIHYNKYDKPLLSMFEKLSYNEKLDVLAEVFIRLGNDTLFNHKYQMLELSIDGFETARNIIKQKI